MWDWITGFRTRRRQLKERTYWALREAEAMRMQHGATAEKVCDAILAQTDVPHRKRRFIILVRKQLAKV